MHEISFQAVQHLPRLISVITLLLLTWLVAKFAKSVVLRANSSTKKVTLLKKFVIKMSDVTFWMVIFLFSPFILGAAGLDAGWLPQVQLYIGHVFSNWPIWMLMSVVIAGIGYLLLIIPKLIIQIKESPDTSPRKF